MARVVRSKRKELMGSKKNKEPKNKMAERNENGEEEGQNEPNSGR